MKIIGNKKILIALLVVIICLIALGAYNDRRTCWGSNDFDTYYFAGKLFSSGENLYTHEAFRTTLSPYLYLPCFAAIISLLSHLNIRIASLIWYIFNIMFLVGSVYFSWLVIRGKSNAADTVNKVPRLILLITTVFIVGMWLDVVSLAQVDFMIFFLLILSVFLFEKDREFSSGVLLSFATAIKIYPVFFLLYFIVKRKWKVACGFFAGLVVFLYLLPVIIMGQSNFIDSMNSWIDMRAAPYLKSGGEKVADNYNKYDSLFKPKNQSLSAVTIRYLTAQGMNFSRSAGTRRPRRWITGER